MAYLKVRSLFLLAVFNILVSVALADGPALDIGDPHGGSVFRQGTYSLGWRFTANGPLVVTALGIFDDKKDGLIGSHEVGIFDASDCNLLRKVTVTPADGRVGYFRYHKIEALGLIGSKDYYIAAVTNDDKYLLSPTTLTTDGLISFGGFAIYGATQTSTELRCPNGPHNSPTTKGDFGPNFYIGTLPSVISNPGSGNDPEKRDTALTVFCNRTGPTLSTAKCTATLTDTGAPPRFLPSGAINWIATDGFVPASASCFPTQVSLSPGVGACEVEFSVPAGFNIGAKFPISVSYAGDSNFNGSSAGHKLINPGCVSTNPNKPCPNSIGLTFPGSPVILKEQIKAVLECGGKAASTSGLKTRDTLLTGGACHVSGIGSGLISEIFKALSFDDAKALSQVISDKEAQNDALLNYMKQVEQVQTAERWKLIQNTQEILQQIEEDIIKNRDSVRKSQDVWAKYIRDNFKVRKTNGKKPKFDKSIKTATLKFDVKPNKQKTVTFRLPKRLKTWIGLYKKAQIATIPLNISLTVKQDKRKGKATVSETVNFAIK